MQPDPTILAFDTSAAHCAVALYSGGVIGARRYAQMAKGQAENLMPMIGDVMARAGVSYGDITAIGVGVGPGNFTGIRISVSAARGLSLALGVRAIGVSALEALAYGHGPGPVLACIDARQGRAYMQLFDRGVAISTPQLAELDEIPDELRRPHMRVVGHGATDVSVRFDADFVISGSDQIAPVICKIAATRIDLETPRPAPLYIRPADAAPPRDPAPIILS